MLFEIHKEGRIAYKRLSDADLKRGNSHQTHIGLSMDSLTFMPDNKTEYSAMLIYKNYCDILNCEIAKIHRANGDFNAPKISTGKNRGNNVVYNIRDVAKKSPNKDFYLLWFGLDSLTPVFFLIEEDSSDFLALDSYCDFDSLGKFEIRILDDRNLVFSQVFKYIKNKIAEVAESLQKDLEISAEIEDNNPKFKDVDVKKAQNYIAKIGREGELLINEYLERLKFDKSITEFEWMNKSTEQGKPYDFFIRYANGQEQWVDVKTTEHEFGQAVIVSKNEIKFITDKKNSEYSIFRVYSKMELQAKLKICSDCLSYIKKLYRDIDYMTQSMSDYRASIVNYKIAFEPSNLAFKNISNEISVSGTTA